MSAKSSSKGAKRTSSKNSKPLPVAAAKPTSAKKKTSSAGGAKSASAVARAATNNRAKNEADTFYVVVEHDEFRISANKPAAKSRVHVAGSFAEAKELAIESLIELIDGLEERLWQIKQSRDFANYQELVKLR
jgi:hypothetical protein